jgi:putative hydrolase
VYIIVNSDAHDPSQVGKLELAEALLEEEQFPKELILNTNCEKLVRFLTGAES